MRNLIMLTVLALSTAAHAAKYETEKSNLFLDQEGKQISAVEAYRSETPIFECTKKEVVHNSRTGKPKLKKVD